MAVLVIGCAQTTDRNPTERPNILFAIMDDATYLYMSAYGCEWVDTPNFDRVAREGLLFNRAYTPNAKCAPSRSIILTGRHSWQLEEAANHWPYFPAKFKVFTEVLDEQGYHVGSTGKGWGPGVATREDGSRRNLMINTFNGIKTSTPTPQISAVDYSSNFEEFLDARGERPFFFWYGGYEPHRRYEYGSGVEKGGKSLDQIPDEEVFAFWPATDSVKNDLLDYAYEIEYFDQQLGKMLDMLEERGELDNTLVVVTADNGMPFPRVKGQVYEYSNHLPLAMRWPKGISEAGKKIDDLVSFLDFAPTFLELAGISSEQSGMAATSGVSLKGLFTETHDPSRWQNRSLLLGKERHDIGRPGDAGYPVRGIIRGDMLYLHNFENDRWPAGNPETGYLNTDGSPTKTVVLNGLGSANQHQYWQWSFGKKGVEELYNIATDPDCVNNLGNDAGHAELMQTMKTELFDRLNEQGDPRMAGQGQIFDEYAYSDKGGVGFYERYFSGEEVGYGWVNESDFQSKEVVESALEKFGAAIEQ